MRRYVPHILLAFLTIGAGLAAWSSNSSRLVFSSVRFPTQVCGGMAKKMQTVQVTAPVKRALETKQLALWVNGPANRILIAAPMYGTCGNLDSPGHKLVMGYGTSIIVGNPPRLTVLISADGSVASRMAKTDSTNPAPPYDHASYSGKVHGHSVFLFASCIRAGHPTETDSLCYNIVHSMIETNRHRL